MQLIVTPPTGSRRGIVARYPMADSVDLVGNSDFQRLEYLGKAHRIA